MTTALISMCKAPEPGLTKTRLCPPLTPAQASEFYEALLLDTLDLIESIPGTVPIAAITPASGLSYFERLKRYRLQLWPVNGADIGMCLTSVMSRALTERHTTAIAINSDGPTLAPQQVNEATTALDEGADVVFGPNADGGYYLVGLKQIRPRLFLNGDQQFDEIEWSTERVWDQTLERAEALKLKVTSLPTNHDVDTVSDLLPLSQHLDSLPADRCRHTREWLAANPLIRME